MEEHLNFWLQTPARLFRKFSRVIAIAFCLITLFYGILVLNGRQLSYPLLPQISQTIYHMTYDAALSFCVASIGLLAIHFRKNYITLITIFFLILFSILTIIQYLFHINLNIIHKFITLFVQPRPNVGDKMLPITPFCFLLISLSMLYLIQNGKSNYFKSIFAMSQSIITLCLAILFLFGYSLRFENQFYDKFLPLMSTNTAIGFVFLSFGLIFTVISINTENKIDYKKILPAALAAFIAVFNLIAWRLLSSQDQVANLLKTIHRLESIQELAMVLLISLALYFFQKNYIFQKKFKRLYALTKATLNATQEGILVLNNKGNIVDYNSRFSQLLNITPMDVIGSNQENILKKIFSNLKNPQLTMSDFSNWQKNPKKTLISEMQLKNGQILEFNSYPQRLEDKLIGYVYSFHDITHLKQAEEKLLFQATHDVLTTLPNRFLLFEHIVKAIDRAKRKNSLIAILFIDLDGFKLINDSLSHIVGDKVLKAVADRFLSCTRQGDTLARVGGDEFILLAADLENREDIKSIAHRFLQVLMPPFKIHNHELHVRCSIGISIYPDDGKKFNHIVENADIAMYFAKKNSEKVIFYNKEMHQKIVSRLKLENDLPDAIEKEEFEIYYQPIFDLASNKICETEALIRWNHPVHGLLMPDEFINIAEESGQISAIGSWVLKTACMQNKSWQEKNILQAKVSVNISIKQLIKPKIFDEISRILLLTGMEPKYLQLELTENRQIPNIEETAILLNQFKSVGINIAIDDFGTGYNGLTYLKQFPIDTIKIDKSLIENSSSNLIERAIVISMINICNELKISSCVEGIETEEQYQFITNNHCKEAQGYYFSKPLPLNEYEEFIRQQSF